MGRGRRSRRFGIGTTERHGGGGGAGLLPLVRPTSPTPAAHRRLHSSSSSSSSASCSCWYCDFKIYALNEPLLHLGRRYSRHFRLWFSIGVGFAVASLLGIALGLLYELARSLHVLHCKVELSSLLFGFSPMVSDMTVSLADAGYIFLSTLISVSCHEFGHAVAAASEGIQAEYVAIFVAVLFPGALVAFDYELLQAVPKFSALRIYCAGIWHNAVICAICGLTLLLLPWILLPMYIHGENPMVLDVPNSSPLYGYLSPHDMILSVDGIPIHSPQEWVDLTALIDGVAFPESNYTKQNRDVREGNGEKGYCVPNVLIEGSEKIQLVDNISTCPYDFSSFTRTPCSETSLLYDHPGDSAAIRRDRTYCLNSQEIVKLKKCGTGWLKAVTNGSSCICSEDESCLAPIHDPGSTWIEISYASPYSKECLQSIRKLDPSSQTSLSTEPNCSGSFVYVGDLISLAQSVWLTAYQPRWAFGIGTYLPHVLEKIVTCTFHVSLMLAIVNGLPVFLLDGESILEAGLCYSGLLRPRERERVLRVILWTGTVMSIIALLRMVHTAFL
ncbi:membrane-bound transcription factor site-2 protease homolog isoform X1 [Syzygium oleosum]|uniref:membrane-bound transcription factor site-2 protease homolog isoform X1 n=1 Tax=Syzygium oleosum TaxID=219896 RepID=UPI0011D2299D|nr:membrane-bound transcription factor site-2 protease homolog isoform X1 [Syzygium oleosum]